MHEPNKLSLISGIHGGRKAVYAGFSLLTSTLVPWHAYGLVHIVLIHILIYSHILAPLHPSLSFLPPPIIIKYTLKRKERDQLNKREIMPSCLVLET